MPTDGRAESRAPPDVSPTVGLVTIPNMVVYDIFSWRSRRKSGSTFAIWFCIYEWHALRPYTVGYRHSCGGEATRRRNPKWAAARTTGSGHVAGTNIWQ